MHIFIDMPTKNQAVEKLLSEKRVIEKQIDEIQHTCGHERQVMKQVPDKSSFSIRYICTDCGKLQGYPSPEETKKFLE
jgi:hypothetical protein|tara:strand:+ start:771 stop:1004 length:234 start_codon:yes stop_codon:yes gene_type:complete